MARWRARIGIVLLVCVGIAVLWFGIQRGDAGGEPNLTALVRDVRRGLPWHERVFGVIRGWVRPVGPMVPPYERLRSPLERRRSVAVAHLQRMRTNAWPAIPVLLDELEANDPFVRSAAASALSRISGAAEETFPVFRALLEHRLVSVRIGALRAIAELSTGASSLRLDVERLISDENAVVRQAAEAALRRIDGRGPAER